MNSFLRPRCKVPNASISRALIRPITRYSNTLHGWRKLSKKYTAAESALFNVSEEVTEATVTHKPVVALESTIYTHGFPYPDNVSLAHDLEALVRNNGGIPATIGILNGVAHIGLTSEQLTEIASAAGDPETRKVSRRDIPFLLGMGLAGRKMTGGTTIAGTMFLAAKAGISVFGTGGLGGVHRGGQDTMDISADLTELGRTRVAVISSGCKSFLDIPRTLEYLETQGAGVYTFADGRTGPIEYPAFYTRESGILSPMVVQNEKEAAAIIYAQDFFRHGSGFHFANPIPEEFSIPKSEIDQAINQAVEEAAEQGIHGHANTPFILSRIKELTKGNSVAANRALIESNIKVATKVAVELSRMRLERAALDDSGNSGNSSDRIYTTSSHFTTPSTDKAGNEKSSKDKMTKVIPHKNGLPKPSIVVVGSVAFDLSCDYTPGKSNKDTSPRMHTSNIGEIRSSIGGVGYNVALAARLSSGEPVRLCSIVVMDQTGNGILKTLAASDLDTNALSIVDPTTEYRSAQYIAMNDSNKDLVIAMADMSIFTSSVNSPAIQNIKAPLGNLTPATKWLILDANWHPDTIQRFIDIARKASPSTMIAFEPVSTVKSTSLFPADNLPALFPSHIVDLAAPNQDELIAMHDYASTKGLFEPSEYFSIIDSFGIPSTGARDRFVALTSSSLTDDGIPFRTIQLLPYIPTIFTKLGKDGVLLTMILKPNDPRLTDPKHSPYILSRATNAGEVVGGVYMRLFPAVEKVEEKDVVSVNGAGDTFLGVLVAGLAKGVELGEELVEIAQKAAVITLKSREAVGEGVRDLKGELDNLARR
ncbi:hypothetical protein ACMFMG_003180 [Clarireedia jacksonii]